jgi:hypothetical protein
VKNKSRLGGTMEKIKRKGMARLQPQPNRFGLRREAKRHAALEALSVVEKAVSPLRSATALQMSFSFFLASWRLCAFALKM